MYHAHDSLLTELPLVLHEVPCEGSVEVRGAQVRSGMLREPLRTVLHDVNVQMKEVFGPDQSLGLGLKKMWLLPGYIVIRTKYGF